ncbi:MAG: ubiquinol-cytochrome C chaperone family protein [Hyphomicrobiales bacterium]
MILSRFFRRRNLPAQGLYGAIVAAARQPLAYAQWGVPDTVEGRFDMIILHQFLVLERLKAGGAATEALMQELTDAFFSDMDRSLREMGVGDLSVGKKVRRMAEAYHGRLQAYAASFADPAGFTEALRRNIFAGVAVGQPEALAAHARTVANHLQGLATQDLLHGRITFP